MKKSISVTLLAIILLQSCVIYQNTPVSLEEVLDKGKVKVEKNGKKLYFNNIIWDENSYYGVTSTYNMLLDSTVSVYLQYIPYSTIGQDKVGSIGFGLGGASVAEVGHDLGAGFGFNGYLNCLFNINDHISTGIELNGNSAFILGGGTSGLKIETTAINGILAKGKYVFSNNRSAPFIGIMAGIYNIKPGGVEAPIDLEFDKKTTFGFAPEFGGHFNSFQLSTSFHFPGKYKTDRPNSNGGTTSFELQYFIWQFNLGWNIGFGNK